MNEKVFLATFEQRLKDEFIQKCFSDIRNSDRCRLYKEIKTVFECESYMNCNIRRDVRVCFTKLRLSSHSPTHNAHVHSAIVMISKMNIM